MLSVLLGTALSAQALAQTTSSQVNSINVQTFNPSTSNHFVFLEDAFRSEWPKKPKTYFGLNYNYVSEPFVSINAATGEKDRTLIDPIQSVDLMLGFKLSSRFGIFFGLPFHIVNYPVGSRLLTNQSTAVSNTTIGDMKILGKIRLTNDDSNVHIALIPEIHLPTGNTANFVSDASTYLAIRGIIEREFKKFTLNTNLGFAAASNSIYNPGTGLNPIDYRKRLIFGIGGYVPFNDLWGASVEFNSESMIPFDANNNPNELYAGVRHQFSESGVATLGGSLGKFGGTAGQNYRIVAGIRFNLYEAEETPITPASQLPALAPTPRVVLKPKQIEVSEPVKFQEDSAVLTDEGKGLLNEVATLINQNKASLKKIQIDGHTNNNGGETHNLQLSLNRSRAVKKYLISKGVASNILEARGFGQMKPKVPNTDPKAIEINRRVEFNIVQ